MNRMHEKWRFARRLLGVAVLATAATGALVPQIGGKVFAEEDREAAEVQVNDAYTLRVEQWSGLMKQRRFAEAVGVATKARLLEPQNPTSELMVLKARAAMEASNAASNLIAVEFTDDRAPGQMHVRIADEELDALIFGESRATARTRLVGRLAIKIASIDRICNLTDEQKHRLELAGRGDVKRLFDRIDALQPQPDEGHVVDDRRFRIWAQRLNTDAGAIRRTYKSGVFEGGSLFAKTLKTTLTAEQAAACAKAPPMPTEGGFIRWVDPVGKKVWIGLGGDDGVKPGTTYHVWTKAKAPREAGKPQAGGADKVKGTIEVTRILEGNLSEARILDELADHPVAKGDPIVPQQANPK
jgi:hypothetical protein